MRPQWRVEAHCASHPTNGDEDDERDASGGASSDARRADGRSWEVCERKRAALVRVGRGQSTAAAGVDDWVSLCGRSVRVLDDVDAGDATRGCSNPTSRDADRGEEGLPFR